MEDSGLVKSIVNGRERSYPQIQAHLQLGSAPKPLVDWERRGKRRRKLASDLPAISTIETGAHLPNYLK